MKLILKKIQVLILAILSSFFIVKAGYAATYYMPDDFANLQAAFAGMSSGDTLIIRDGVYTGDLNVISNSSHPPYGSADAWTIIKAENDGGVVFDGETTLRVFSHYPGSIGNKYWQFEGIIWGRSTVLLGNSRYVKFLRCGAYDGGDGNSVNFNISRNCEYILLENCYAWGNGRYKFMAYQNSRIIFRQCVGRLDRVNAPGEPIAVFSMYSVDDAEVQNCIAIDSDQDSDWVGFRNAAFNTPCTDMPANRINYTRCIALNNKLGGISTSGKYTISSDVTFKDCVIWNSSTSSGVSINTIRGLRTNILNCTFGESTDTSYSYILSYDGIGYNNDTTIKNSIFWNIQDNPSYAALNDVETEDYNCLYANTNNYTNTSQGTNTHLNTNPIWDTSANPNGALRYICRIEDGSNLSGQGENGVNIGANCTKMYGVLGTLWGEAGYNEEQSADMWPFPYEDLIRAKMKAYSEGGVSGDR